MKSRIKLYAFLAVLIVTCGVIYFIVHRVRYKPPVIDSIVNDDNDDNIYCQNRYLDPRVDGEDWLEAGKVCHAKKADRIQAHEGVEFIWDGESYGGPISGTAMEGKP